MFEADLLYFLGASIILTIAPGPDNIFVVTQGISRGKKAAVLTALGMCSGVSVHTAAAALGVSAIFYSSALLFNMVKYAGAGYLLFLAWKTLQKRKGEELPERYLPTRDYLPLFRHGFVMNVCNPKVALFFLAFFPQFVVPGTESFLSEMVILGGIFMLQAVLIFTVIAYFSGVIGDWFIKRSRVSGFFSWTAAVIFACLGIRLALVQQ
ncbi:MAG: LysE family translocator [Thermodesulfobacteriota bacterium]